MVPAASAAARLSCIITGSVITVSPLDESADTDSVASKALPFAPLPFADRATVSAVSVLS